MPAWHNTGFLRFTNRVPPRRQTMKGKRALKGKAAGVGAALVLSAGLGGCMTANNAEPSVFINDCLVDRADIVENVDWAAVQPYRVRIVGGDYRPMVVYVEQSRPYILILENADNKDHDFWAPDFLKSAVALDSIQFEGKAPAKGCVNGVRIKARSSVTLRFVPVWEGRYEIRDVNFALTPTVGATAVVNVVRPRVGTTVN